MGAQPPSSRVFEERSSPSCRESGWCSPPGMQREPRKIQVFNSESYKPLFQIVQCIRFSVDLLHTTPRMKTWTSLSGCSSQPLCASVAAPPKLCTWRRWLRYSFVFFYPRYVRRRAPRITDPRHSTWLADCHRERTGYARRKRYLPE